MVEPEPDDIHLSMMERRPWSRRLNRQLPARFRDDLPQPLPSLPPTVIHQPPASVNVQCPPAHSEQTAQSHFAARVGSHISRMFTTSRNIFGLSRRFYGKEMPLDDPEAQLNLSDLSVCENPLPLPSQAFYPFPNRNAFKLGDWFWNGGGQKSLRGFHELMNIIGDSEFNVEDVREINWGKVNGLLAADEEGEWVDQDAGWVRTPVTISVPYQPRRGQLSDPQGGPRNYVVDNFYHRSLVDIIKHKISGLNERHFFHTEPHEVHWQPPHFETPIRVQGELYTSPSFIDAHQEVQDLPGEPGCDLPRVIAAQR